MCLVGLYSNSDADVVRVVCITSLVASTIGKSLWIRNFIKIVEILILLFGTTCKYILSTERISIFLGCFCVRLLLFIFQVLALLLSSGRSDSLPEAKPGLKI